MLITDIEHGKLSRERSGKFQAAPWPQASQTTTSAGKQLAIELEIHRARCRSNAVAAARRILNSCS